MRRILVLPLALSIGCAPVIKIDSETATAAGLPEDQPKCKRADMIELNRGDLCGYLEVTLRDSRGKIYFQMRQRGGCRELFYDFDTDGKLDYWRMDDYAQERFDRLRQCPQAR